MNFLNFLMFEIGALHLKNQIRLSLLAIQLHSHLLDLLMKRVNLPLKANMKPVVNTLSTNDLMKVELEVILIHAQNQSKLKLVLILL